MSRTCRNKIQPDLLATRDPPPLSTPALLEVKPLLSLLLLQVIDAMSPAREEAADEQGHR